MFKSCKYCGGIHDVKMICPKKPTKQYPSNRHASVAGDLRKKSLWKNKSIEIRQRDRYLCRYCLSKGIITADGLSVHHIIPINENSDYWLDNDYLITLCDKCHEEADRGLIDREKLIEIAHQDVKLSPG